MKTVKEKAFPLYEITRRTHENISKQDVERELKSVKCNKASEKTQPS